MATFLCPKMEFSFTTVTLGQTATFWIKIQVQIELCIFIQSFLAQKLEFA